MARKIEITDAQAQALFSASEDLAAYLAMDACRVIAEWPDDANLVPYLEKIPVKVARAFDDAVSSIQHGKMDSFTQEAEQRRKYAEAMLTPTKEAE